MKKLILVLVAVFVIGGAAISFASSPTGSNDDSEREANTYSLEESNTQGDLDDKELSEPVKTNGGDIISMSEAITIALSVIDGTVKEVELEKDDGVLYYEVEIKYGGEDYDIDINAYTGEIIKVDDDFRGHAERNKKVEVEVSADSINGTLKGDDDSTKNSGNSSDTMISPQKAGEIALAHIGSGKIDDIELETKNGSLVFEVEIEDYHFGDDDDVDVYIDAFTGEVVYVDFD
ncbi:PepSY domain-containing protein [Evansella tamaricis]|uniref:PepSY domain-containing protein n=1 Tax=Evansella tamaricis TaxID=2069301 RepID=A0ABS6JIH5_9BACI|nr:PepSY domain-containing protein [Evansella tamaricis]MBU9713479.1 PepSY domain-containing protein [Evansella tamaricis]